MTKRIKKSVSFWERYKFGLIVAGVAVVLGVMFFGQRLGLNILSLSSNAYLGGTQVTNNNLIFIDSLGRWSLGHFINDTQAAVDLYPGDKATFSAYQITWDDGGVWKVDPIDTPSVGVTYYKNQDGALTNSIQNGAGGSVGLINAVGRWSLGHWLSAQELSQYGLTGSGIMSDIYPGDPMHFVKQGGVITMGVWKDGTVWTPLSAADAQAAGSPIIRIVKYTNPKGLPVYVIGPVRNNQSSISPTPTSTPSPTPTFLPYTLQ
jgi:hypothetical protein